MRRRLDLAASLIGHPTVLFLDEPTTGLDPNARAMMWDIVRGLAADGTTLLLTTQYLEEADQLARRVAVIDHGRVIAEGTPASSSRPSAASSLEITLAAGADVEAAVTAVKPYATAASSRTRTPAPHRSGHRVRRADHRVVARWTPPASGSTDVTTRARHLMTSSSP